MSDKNFNVTFDGNGSSSLTFAALRNANIARLPEFKNKHGHLAHARADGSDWTVASWLQAVVGELGEFANIRKKFERGDLSAEEYAIAAAKELADVQTYLDILALRALDMQVYDRLSNTVKIIPHGVGINLGLATVMKFNEVSARVGSAVRLQQLLFPVSP